MEEFAESDVHAGVIPALVEFLRSRLTWVEQRVAMIDKVVPTLVDLVEITTLGDHKKFDDSILGVLQDYIQS
ncbi:hypothetical protein Ahy_A08g037957 [Arachis hypogaea]|uniref:ARM repeat N-terminal plant domain-containing protein n=1 Tax=Arachis hypogaea TaxID=3818 RepID=A0A445BSF7_ARAHY|nr:hypothetical protein Ahy_A08g037957 [Arachis hypogaea]